METQVYRLTPEAGKYYETAEYTRRKGRWPNVVYYTTNKMQYVGKFVKHLQFGYHDSAIHIDIFDNNGEEIQLHYTYEGTTSFREVEKVEIIIDVLDIPPIPPI